MSSSSVHKSLNNGTQIPSVGFGVYLVDAKDAIDSVYLALDAGYRHIDTAEGYKNEAEAANGVKKWLEDNPQYSRKDIYFTTKISSSRISALETAKSIKERVSIINPIIDYIDLVLLHAPMGEAKDRIGAWKALEDYIKKNPNNVKSLGVSNYGVKHLQEIFDNGVIKPVLNQIEINPWLTRKELSDFCRESDIEIEAYSPLGRGKRVNDPEISALAEKYGKTNGQILIKWSLQSGFIPLPKSISPSRIKSNFDVFDWELSTEDLQNLTHDDQYWVSNPTWDPSKND